MHLADSVPEAKVKGVAMVECNVRHSALRDKALAPQLVDGGNTHTHTPTHSLGQWAAGFLAASHLVRQRGKVEGGQRQRGAAVATRLGDA